MEPKKPVIIVAPNYPLTHPKLAPVLKKPSEEYRVITGPPEDAHVVNYAGYQGAIDHYLAHMGRRPIIISSETELIYDLVAERRRFIQIDPSSVEHRVVIGEPDGTIKTMTGKSLEDSLHDLLKIVTGN